MTDKFTIKVPGDGFGDFEDCQYHAGKKGSYDPFIDLDSRTCLTKLSCFAILRKLAELSEEEVSKQVVWGSDPYPYYKCLGGLFTKEHLEEFLWEVLKSKYKKNTLTTEDKIKKAVKILRGGIYVDGKDSDISALQVLEGGS